MGATHSTRTNRELGRAEDRDGRHNQTDGRTNTRISKRARNRTNTRTKTKGTRGGGSSPRPRLGRSVAPGWNEPGDPRGNGAPPGGRLRHGRAPGLAAGTRNVDLDGETFSEGTRCRSDRNRTDTRPRDPIRTARTVSLRRNLPGDRRGSRSSTHDPDARTSKREPGLSALATGRKPRGRGDTRNSIPPPGRRQPPRRR